jgi:predicted membrane protein
LEAEQLTHPQFLANGNSETAKAILSAVQVDPALYFWTYIFAFSIGFSTTLAEPALIAVAIKAREISTGAISEWGLRIAVALGVGFGVTLGVYRIVMGTPLYLYIAFGYLFLIFQTIFAPKAIIPLAYDSGGVTTSTVTVPVLAALGIGLASNVPGRSPMIDGFGLIAFASLFPIIAVLAYAMIGKWIENRAKKS